MTLKGDPLLSPEVKRRLGAEVSEPVLTPEMKTHQEVLADEMRRDRVFRWLRRASWPWRRLSIAVLRAQAGRFYDRWLFVPVSLVLLAFFAAVLLGWKP